MTRTSFSVNIKGTCASINFDETVLLRPTEKKVDTRGDAWDIDSWSSVPSLVNSMAGLLPGEMRDQRPIVA